MHGKIRLILISALLPVFVLLSSPAPAEENHKDFGEYVLHFNALTTDQLTPKIASDYRIMRSRSRGMINITLVKKIPGSIGRPVRAVVEVDAVNLVGQRRDLRVREIREADAIYYIAEFRVSHEETLEFRVAVKPPGMQDPLEVRFRQDFYTR